jgi:hypothetical protein
VGGFVGRGVGEICSSWDDGDTWICHERNPFWVYLALVDIEYVSCPAVSITPMIHS